MTARDHLRALVDAAPADAMLTVPASWLRDALGATSDAPVASEPVDLTVAEFGLRFGKSASTVRTWCALGRVPGAWRLSGKTWRIPAKSVELFRQAQGAKPTELPRHSEGDLGDWRRRPKPAA